MLFDVDEIFEEGLDFDVQKKKESFDIDQPEFSLVKDVRVVGTLKKVGKDIFLTGRITTELSLQCSRCLEQFRYPAESVVTAHFVPGGKVDKEHAEVELKTSDIDIEFYKENQVDITQLVHDQIVLDAPLMSLCKQDCKGLCPECGKNLNNGPCGCSKDFSVDPRLEILKSLKEKLK